MPLRPLLLNGPPAVGTSSVARALADSQPAWEPGEGARQTRLPTVHACMLMSSFHGVGFTVITTDVLLWDTGSVYLSHRPRPLVVHLRVSLDEALRRALADGEFRHLHACERGADFCDVEMDATDLSLLDLTATLTSIWCGGARA